MKHLPNIAAALLGLAFIVFGLNFFLQFLPMPMPAEGSPPAMFMGAMFATGYLAFVKVLEIAGGVLILLPATRSIGLLILGPIIVNILAYHLYLMGGEGLLGLPVVLALLSLFLLWTKRTAFLGLLTK